MKRKVQESLQSDELLDREGDFYTRAAGWDYYRLPLIDPFEASNTTGDLWLISNDLLSSIEGNSGPCGIKSINVDKPYIFVYCEAKDKKDELSITDDEFKIMLKMNLNNVDLFWEDKLY